MTPVSLTALLLLAVVAPAVASHQLQNETSTTSTNKHWTPPTSCPDGPLTATDLHKRKLTACKVLIVGGGPGGLFAAYFLRSLGPALCVVEKEDVWGGKMQATPYPPDPAANLPGGDKYAVGTCGLRILQPFTDFRCFVSRLGHNITTETSDFDTMWSRRGSWYRSTQSFLGADGGGTGPNLFPGVKPADPSNTDLESSMLEYTLVLSTDINPITGKSPKPHPATKCGDFSTVGGYLTYVYGVEGFRFLQAGNTFRGDFTNTMDVCGYIQFFRADWERNVGDIYYPVGGFPPIYKSIRDKLVAARVSMIKSSEVTCLSEVVNKHQQLCTAHAGSSSCQYKYAALTADGSGWKAERLIINAAPMNVLQMGGSLGKRLAADPHITNILPIKVVLYNAFWPTRFWEDYGLWKYDNFRIISDGRCTERSEFLGSGSYIPINASRPVYADQQVCVKEWTDIYSKGGLDAVRARALERVRKMFPLQQIPPPTSDAFYISPNAWHYLVVGATQRGITIEGIKQWALAPFKDPSLCMVGEPYNLIDATWSYAAWKSAIYCLQANYGDVMTPQEKAELSFYLSGCMGANSFPNEIISPTNVSLPGLDPSTGKLGPPTKHFSRVTRP